MRSLIGTVLTGAWLAAAAAAPCPAAEPRGVHDPVIAAAEGGYYVFCTGRGIPILRSTDLVNWQRAGSVFDRLPDWATEAVPGARSLWAPDIAFHDGRYLLYYSVSTFGSRRSCIGLATNVTLDPASPDHRWVDQGKVVESTERDDHNAIDPNFILDEEGRPWLAFGSFWGGIKLVRLDPKTGLASKVDRALHTLAARPRPDRAVEAPFIVRREGWFYLFVSFDRCCRGVESTYRIMVGRSRKLTGPYVDADGRPMLEGGGTQVLAGAGHVRGPGHNAVLHHGGRWLLVHHYYDARARGAPTLQVRPLSWDERGWPVAGQPLGADAVGGDPPATAPSR